MALGAGGGGCLPLSNGLAEMRDRVTVRMRDMAACQQGGCQQMHGMSGVGFRERGTRRPTAIVTLTDTIAVIRQCHALL